MSEKLHRWASSIDGLRMVTLERRIWRWEVRALGKGGWIINWWSPWSWLRPVARKHMTLAEAQAEKNRYMRAALDRLAAP